MMCCLPCNAMCYGMLCFFVLRCHFPPAGGFVYFDREDAVLGVLALSSQPTRHFCLYHNPETLDARDADR